MDISIPIEFGVKWKGRYLRPSKHAIREMIGTGMDLYDVLYILENGNEGKGQRAKGTIERSIRRGKKILKAVVISSYAYDIEEYVWLVKHVGGR